MRAILLISAALLGVGAALPGKDNPAIFGMTPFILAVLMGLAKSGTA